jgi:hypothetical protein
MNLRRGFFRLWLVFSAFFIIGTGVVSFPDVKSEFKKAAADAAAKAELKAQDFVLDVPVACSDARGKIGDDYEVRDNNCWYSINKFRPLYPEYKDLTEDQVSDRLYEKAGFPIIPPASPWTLVSKVISIAIGVPLIVLAIVSALGWSFAGFSNERKAIGR